MGAIGPSSTAVTPITAASIKLHAIADEEYLDDEQAEMDDDQDPNNEDDNDEVLVIGNDVGGSNNGRKQCLDSHIATWPDNGYTYTEAQISEISSKKSAYEQNKVVNVIRNKVGDLVKAKKQKSKQPADTFAPDVQRSALCLVEKSVIICMFIHYYLPGVVGQTHHLKHHPNVWLLPLDSNGHLKNLPNCQHIRYPQIRTPQMSRIRMGAAWMNTVSNLIKFEYLMGCPTGNVSLLLSILFDYHLPFNLLICLGCNKDVWSQRSKYKSYGALRVQSGGKGSSPGVDEGKDSGIAR